jgi:cytochrome d ubiquinol oxidase subunit II
MTALARPITIALLAATIGIVSLWTPFAHPDIAARWFSLPNIFFFCRCLVLVLVTSWLILRCWNEAARRAVPARLFLLFLGYSGLASACGRTSSRRASRSGEAAAPPQSMGFALVGALFIIPFILAYTAWSYYVFRGKVKAGEGYH